jgi:hypothetical protein
MGLLNAKAKYCRLADGSEGLIVVEAKFKVSTHHDTFSWNN